MKLEGDYYFYAYYIEDFKNDKNQTSASFFVLGTKYGEVGIFCGRRTISGNFDT